MYSMVCILKMDRHNPMIPNTEGQEVMHDESAKPYAIGTEIRALKIDQKYGSQKFEKFQMFKICSMTSDKAISVIGTDIGPIFREIQAPKVDQKW